MQVVHLVVSPDGKRIASCDHDENDIRLWDGLTGREIAVLRGHTFCPEVLAFSPDGARLASGGTYPDVAIRLWESATGRPIAIVTWPREHDPKHRLRLRWPTSRFGFRRAGLAVGRCHRRAARATARLLGRPVERDFQLGR